MSALNCLIFARRKTQFELVQEGKSFKDPIAMMSRRQDAIKRCFQGCREEEIPERYKLPRIHTNTQSGTGIQFQGNKADTSRKKSQFVFFLKLVFFFFFKFSPP